MSNYKAIKGIKVKALSSDPPSPFEGEIWINTTNGKVKYRIGNQVSAWATGGNLNTGAYSLAGCGTQTAGLKFGGTSAPPFTYQTSTEEYNGTSWTSGGSLATGRRYLGGLGTQTAGLAFGGSTPPAITSTEEYDGSTWTAGGALPVGNMTMSAAGTQTAGLSIGGSPSPPLREKTFEYNGTSWSPAPDMATFRSKSAGMGIQTAALAAGGEDGALVQTSNTESYNGTTWGAEGQLTDGRAAIGGGGTTTSAFICGGNRFNSQTYNPGPPGFPNTAKTEEYNGTSWLQGGNLSTSVQNHAACGSVPAGLSFGGYPPANLSLTNSVRTEEYSGPQVREVQEITTG